MDGGWRARSPEFGITVYGDSKEEVIDKLQVLKWQQVTGRINQKLRELSERFHEYSRSNPHEQA